MPGAATEPPTCRNGLIASHGNTLAVGDPSDQYECAAELQWLAGNVVVSDNGHCGGMNVRFDAVYGTRP